MLRVSGPDPQRSQIDAAVLRWIREVALNTEFSPDPERFDALALELFDHQFRHCLPFRRFCELRGRTPKDVTCWREIPAVPTGAFKELALRSFPESRTLLTFRTSGTATASRGELHLDTLDLYEASLRASFAYFMLPDLDALGGRIALRILAPDPSRAADSSLTHMFACLIRSHGANPSAFDWDEDGLRVDELLAAIEVVSAANRPVALCGTSFAFVHLLEELERRGRSLCLADASRIMETGGFKGRSRELLREELYSGLEKRLGVPSCRIVNQYGMTELASQFYDSVLREPNEPRRKLGPPWAAVRVLDPRTDLEVEDGETGILTITDLANTGSVLALQTADLGRRVGGGFEILGREPDAEARGCSIAADEMLVRPGS